MVDRKDLLETLDGSRPFRVPPEAPTLPAPAMTESPWSGSGSGSGSGSESGSHGGKGFRSTEETDEYQSPDPSTNPNTETSSELEDRFGVGPLISRGGMGDIFLARPHPDLGLPPLVALKRMNLTAPIGATEGIDSFLREMRMASTLVHPHLGRTLDAGWEDRRPYLVLEYLRGKSLRGLLEGETVVGKRIPLPVALRVVLDILEGLEYAHNVQRDGHPVGLVHRDVSPENIVVTFDGPSKLVDFGLAKSAFFETRVGQVKGKFGYIAPEQLLGVPVDPRADIFSLGVVLWELLTKQKLFPSDDNPDALVRFLSESVPKVSTVMGSVSPELDGVVAKATHRNAKERFPSAKAMGDALRASASPTAPIASHDEVAAWMASGYGEEKGAAMARERELLPPASTSSLRLAPSERFPSPKEPTASFERLTPPSRASSPPSPPSSRSPATPSTKSAPPSPRPASTVRQARSTERVVFGFSMAALTTIAAWCWFSVRNSPQGNMGYLSVDSPRPAVVVWQDQALGTTPLVRIPLPVGHQSVTVSTPGGTQNKVFLIHVERDTETTLHVDKL
jgi:serine/threonine-protein kinase